MELSGLLAQQIVAMFLTMAIGYAIVRIGLFKTEDSRVLSNIIVYICSPCVIFDSYLIDLTADKVQGLILAVVVSLFIHIFMIGLTWLLDKLFHFNNIEKVSIIYSNSGYLVIPLVSAVLGKEWVLYTTAFMLVQTPLIWTHGVSVINKGAPLNAKKILLNPNVIATVLGLLFFLLEIRIPTIIQSCVTSFGDMISASCMLVIGMLIGNVNLLWVFKQKRPYLICFIRLIFIPLIAVAAFLCIGHMGVHPEAEYILLIVLLATAAPTATMVTQMAQIYDKDAQYASIINVMTVIFCMATIPLMILLFETFY